MGTASQFSLVVGIVDDLDDKQNLGRVLVRYPHLDGVESDWAHIASPMAGKGRGVFLRPEKGEAVLVGSGIGDESRDAYVLGGLWSTEDSPPEGTGKAVDNNIRLIRSRSGHKLVLDDTKGKERIEIVDKDDTRKLVIDSANGAIELTCDGGSVTVKATTIAVEATQDLTLTAKGDATLKATGTLTLKGGKVEIN